PSTCCAPASVCAPTHSSSCAPPRATSAHESTAHIAPSREVRYASPGRAERPYCHRSRPSYCRFVRTTLLAVVAIAAVTGTGTVVGVAPTAAARPAPGIELFTADGRTPLAQTPVHVGDTIVVRGHGFDPEANTSGLPVPVPPGVPHGTFVTFGAFAPDWRPSQGAPSSARATERSAAKWVLSESALNRVPSAPFDFRRTIRHQWVELEPDGDFTATLQVRLPEQLPPAARFGVYPYGAAEAVNAAQELADPVVFGPAPGSNAPAPPPQDLRWAFAPGFDTTVTETLQGSLAGSEGAGIHDD